MNRLKSLLNRSERPLWMGILNATPDSFSDGGAGRELERAAELIAAGADVIDLGGESTRPGSAEIAPEVELARILPVLSGLRREFPDVCISVDTRKSVVAAAVLAAGADAINDVSMLHYSADMAETVAKTEAMLILMHSRGTPESMKATCFTTYRNVVDEVCGELGGAVETAVRHGVGRDRIIVDPGLGFAKTPEADFELLGHIGRLKELGPVLIGHSRKSFLGKTFHIPDPVERESATAAVSIFAALHGADLIRVHDVAASRRAFLAFERCREAAGER